MLTRATAPATISSITPLPSGVKQIEGLGQAGIIFIIEATTNLVVSIPWQSIGADTSDAGGVIQFTDNDATNFLMRFYPVVSPELERCR